MKTKHLVYLSVFFLLIFLDSCTNNNKNTDTDTSHNYYFEDSLAIDAEDLKITDFRTFISDLDSTDVKSSNIAINHFKTVFTGERVSLCDSGFVLLQCFIDTIETKLNERLLEDTTDYSTLFTNENVPLKISKYQTLLNENGFTISNTGDMAYIKQKRDFVITALSAILSQPMQSYLNQIELENREGFVEADTIKINPKQHVDRIMWYEEFVKSNSSFIYLENCKNYKKSYFTYLMTGYGNTKLFENEKTMKLNHYYSEAYKYLQKKYPESETALLLQPYIQCIAKKNETERKNQIKQYIIKGIIYDLHN